MSNLLLPSDGKQSLDLPQEPDYLDHILGGPFETEQEAIIWLENHPECQGLFEKILQIGGTVAPFNEIERYANSPS